MFHYTYKYSYNTLNLVLFSLISKPNFDVGAFSAIIDFVYYL